MSALSSAKGRGKSGLDEEQQQILNSAIELLEENGGVPGMKFFGLCSSSSAVGHA